MDESTRAELSELSKIIETNVSPTGKMELIPLSDAARRISARDVYSEIDVPGFRRSQVDGFAVCGSGPWKLIGGDDLNAGSCIEVQSGSPVPNNAEGILKYKETKVIGDEVHQITEVVEQYIDEIGSDTSMGELLVQRGEILTPQKIAILASTGVGSLWVRSRPEVYIIVTGDEVKIPGVELERGEVYDSTSVILKSFVQRLGGHVREVIRIGDTVDQLKAAIATTFPNVDLILTIGGTSVGTSDIVRTYLEQRGSILFHGLDVRPARPVIMGNVEGVPLIGFPGFTTSTGLMTQILLPKVFARLTGLPEYIPEGRTVVLGEDCSGYRDHIRILPGKLVEGKFFSTFSSSSAVSSFSNSEGYILIEKGKTLIKGTEVFFREYL